MKKIELETRSENTLFDTEDFNVFKQKFYLKGSMKKLKIVSDFDEISYFDSTETPTYTFRAVCTSEPCALKHGTIHTSTGPGVIKDVKKNIDWCPDCEEALFWEKIRVS